MRSILGKLSWSLGLELCPATEVRIQQKIFLDVGCTATTLSVGPEPDKLDVYASLQETTSRM